MCLEIEQKKKIKKIKYEFFCLVCKRQEKHKEFFYI